MGPLDVVLGGLIPRPEPDGRVSRWVRAQLAMLSFWGAVFLPVLYVPLLWARIDTTRDLLLFLGLFGLHVVVLIGGRSHHGAFAR